MQTTFSPKPHRPCSEEHEILVDLPFSHYVTTNYDPCLEEAFASQGKGRAEHVAYTNSSAMVWFASRRQKSPPWVFHMHGYYTEPAEIVLTKHDYWRLYERDARFTTYFRALGIGHPLVFIGFSLTDEGVMGELRHLQGLFDGYSCERFAFLPRPAQEQDAARQRDQLGREYHVEVIYYDVKTTEKGTPDHSGRLEWLRKLAQKVESVPAAQGRDSAPRVVAPTSRRSRGWSPDPE